jgi:hypothetical protein
VSRRHVVVVAAAGVALGAAATAPAPAGAHGLVQRTNLPVPEWLFGWAAAAVLVVSFLALAALWPQPRLEKPHWRPLPGGLGRVLGGRVLEVACGAVGVALLVLVIVAGYVGSASSFDNLAPTFILIIFWVGLAFASVFLGDVFRAFNPWRAAGRATGWLLSRARGGRSWRVKPYPEPYGRYPAAAGLMLFAWIELASGWGEDPSRLVTAALGYTVVTFAAMAIFGVEPWMRRGEAFSVYFNLLSRLSPVETRHRVVGLRPLLGGLPRLDPAPGTVTFVAVMIGSVTFDGLSQSELWKALARSINDAVTAVGVSLETAPTVTATIGLIGAVALVAGFYRLGVSGMHSVGGRFGDDGIGRRFVHSLVPIAAVYVFAHYFTFLLFEGQAIGFLASDPFSRGWDIFGTASSAIDYGLLSQQATWYFQVAFVVAGHIAGLVLAHDRALAIGGNSTQAVRSQYWMLAVMVGFTSLALWLLAQAS